MQALLKQGLPALGKPRMHFNIFGEVFQIFPIAGEG
jgi:hypothetical protein